MSIQINELNASIQRWNVQYFAVVGNGTTTME